MGDGLSDGYRSAREHEARQKSIDFFFGLVLSRVTGIKTDAKDFRGAFEVFDAHRHAGNIASHRIAKTRGKRWETFLGLLDDASKKGVGKPQAMKAWAEILSLALRFASQDVTESLRAVSVFKTCHIALFVPNGTGYHGRTPPSLYGDFAAALDAIAGEPFEQRPYAQVIEDPDRAVVGLTLGSGGGENREEERAKLRFLAVEKP